ncbi:hypothetical protein ACTUVN_004471 [Pseudomonas caspiana]
MAGPAPKTKSSEIADRINDLAAERARTGSINDWNWRLLKKDVEALRRIPALAAQSLIFEAIVWSLASNTAEMERCFNIYAGQYGKDWSWHRARAMQGPAHGRTDMVIDMLEAGYPQGTPSDLRVVAHVCNQSGLFFSSADALNKCLKLEPSSCDLKEVHDLSHLQDTVPFMVENNLDEREISKRIAVASQVVIAMSGPLTTFSIHTSEVGITFEYTVDADIDRLVDIDFAITDKLVSSFEDTMSQYMSIGVTPPLESENSVG